MRRDLLLSWFLWVVAFIFLIGAGYLSWVKYFTDQEITLSQPQPNQVLEQSQSVSANYRIPDFVLAEAVPAITRSAKLYTIIPERERAAAEGSSSSRKK